MFKQKLGLLASTALVASVASSVAFSGAANAQTKDEIIVTATKRQQTLQETPVAVSVANADTIEKAKINDIMDLQTLVPSLRVTQLQNSVQTTFIIRGFGNGANNPGIEPSVGVFIDGVYRARSAGALADLPNLERVEVLRGPQSTLFGKNASAGVISVTTAKPSFETEGSVEATYGNYNNIGLKGYFSTGLSENAAFSVSGGYNKRDGYYENLNDLDDQNDRNRWNVRGQLLFEPSDNVTFRVIADYDKIDEICCGVANLLNGPTGAAVMAIGGQLVPNAPFAREGYYDLNPVNEVENKGISLQADFAFDNFDVTSISAYRDQDVFFDGEVDFTSAAMIGENSQATDTSFFSQELRIASTGDNKVDWLVGGFYYNEDLATETDLVYGPAFRPYGDILSGGALDGIEDALQLPRGTFFAPGQGLFVDFTQDNEAFSLFGQLDFHATDKLTITGGINYTEDRKTVTSSGNSTDVFSGLSLDGQDAATVLTVGGIAQNFPGVTTACGLGPLAFSPSNVGALLAAPGCGGPFTGLNGAQAFQALQGQVAAGVGALNLSDPAQNPLLGLQAFQFLPPYLGFPNSVEDGKSNDDKITWTARISYEVNDNLNIYASAATGFKATTFNLSRDSRPGNLAAINGAGLGLNNLRQGSRLARPEESTVYEIGLKARFDRGSINVAVFDQNIDGFQSNIFTGTGFNLANAGKQSSKGVEVDAMFNPIDPLVLTFGATLLDAKYDSFVNGFGVNGPEDLSGTDVPGVPELAMIASATYTKDFDWGSAYIRGDYQHESDVQVIENTPANVASRSIDMVNGSIGLTMDNGFGGMIWVRNLFEDDFLQQAFPSVAQAGSFSGYPNAPRTYGLTLKKSFP